MRKRPLDAFVLQHRYLAAVFRGVFFIIVISACAKKYGVWLDPDNDLKELDFLTGQAKKVVKPEKAQGVSVENCRMKFLCIFPVFC